MQFDTTVLKQDATVCPIWRVPAGEIERAVIDQIRALLRAPEIVASTWKAARRADSNSAERDVRDALQRFDAL